MTKIALIGPNGRMGRFVEGLLEGREELEIVARIGRSDDLASSLNGAQVGLDLTVAGLGADHARTLLDHGVRPLIGTSGVDPAEDAPLDALARSKGLGGLIVPNFCLGVWLQQRLALDATRFLKSVEIVEEHYSGKVDAPSGTAKDTAAQLEQALGRQPGSLGVHAVRVDGLYSNQQIIFGGTGEVLRLTHQTFGLEAFGSGILASLGYVAQAQGVARGVGHAFEWSAARG